MVSATVKSHIRNVMEKLALRTRLEIAAHARRLRLSNQPETGGWTVGRDDPARAASFIATSQ